MDRQKKIDELRKKIAELEAEEARLAALTEDKRLAEVLHEYQCHRSGCGWLYEISNGVANWSLHEHYSYLRRARKVMESLPDMGVDEIVKVVRAI